MVFTEKVFTGVVLGGIAFDDIKLFGIGVNGIGGGLSLDDGVAIGVGVRMCVRDQGVKAE